MQFAYILWIILMLLDYGESHEIDRVIGKFVGDVTSSFLLSSSFTAFFCTGSDNSLEFSKQMARNYRLHNIQSLKDLRFLNLDEKISNNNWFIVDSDCIESVEFLKKANTDGLFVAPRKWLILQDFQKKSSTLSELQSITGINDILLNVFENFNVFPDSEVILSQRINETTINLLSLYRPSRDHQLFVEDRGIWNVNDGLCLCSREASSQRRVNLQGTLLRTSLVMTDLNTVNHLDDYQDKLVDAVTKASYMWIAYLSERMNATFNYTIERTWGYKDETGRWNGMIGLLDRGEIDIGGTATFMIPQRIGVVDYVQLYTPTGSRFLFRRPPLSYVSNIFTLPFARSVWIAIGVFLAIVFGFLFITLKWEWQRIDKIPEDSRLPTDLETPPTVTDSLLILIGTMFQQGFFFDPRTVSTRIVVLMLLLIALNLYAAYTANIVALLQSSADSIKTLDDLMNSPLKIGIFDIVYNHYYFGAFEDPVRKEFYERHVKDKPSVWMPLDQGIQKVREGLFAFHVDMGFGYQLMQETFEEDEKCGIEEIDYLKVYDPLLVIERQSPYREIIRVGALWLSETGLKPRVASKLFTQKPTCTGSTSFVSVGIIDCYAAIIAIAYGSAISFGIFLLENLWWKCFGQQEIPTDVASPISRINVSALKSSESLHVNDNDIDAFMNEETNYNLNFQ